MDIYKVGGYVRDTLLGLSPKDIDYVVVNSSPKEMLELGFEIVGNDFPVFIHPETREEYALARKEIKTTAGYNGFDFMTDGVSLKDDLFRRDLTINAMAFDSHNNLIDPYGGKKDLLNKTLKHVSKHFAEDPVRILRIARFSARYDFKIHEDTKELIIKMIQNKEFSSLTKERVWLEFSKCFKEKHVFNFFNFLSSCKALKELPGFDNFEPNLNIFKTISTLNISDNNRFYLNFFNTFKNFSKEELSQWTIPSDLLFSLNIYKKFESNQFFYSSMSVEDKILFIELTKSVHTLQLGTELLTYLLLINNQKNIQNETEILKSDILKIKNINFEFLVNSNSKKNIKEIIMNEKIKALSSSIKKTNSI